jgi:hypothetical protein
MNVELQVFEGYLCALNDNYRVLIFLGSFLTGARNVDNLCFIGQYIDRLCVLKMSDCMHTDSKSILVNCIFIKPLSG